MPGTDESDRRIARLEATVRRQQAIIEQQREEIRRLRNELVVERSRREEVEAALLQEREAHRKTRENLADLLQSVETIDERLKAWIRRKFLASSERAVVDAGQQHLAEVLQSVRETEGDSVADALTDMLTDDRVAEEDGAVPATEGIEKKRRRPAKAGGRKPLPADLPRVESTYVPPSDHPMLKNAKRAEQIGTTVIEQLDIPPVRVVVQKMTCPIYRLVLQGGIRTQQTVTPPGVIERGQVSDRFLVASVIDKVQDHLPAYRQETRFARAGAAVPRSKLCRWHMGAADFLAPVAEAILDEIRSEPTVGIDDSVHRLVVPNRHVCKQGRLIAVGGPPGIFYQFQPTREAKWFAQLMAPYSGVVMGDACGSHKQFLARDDILALFCWAHARRKFHEAGDKRRRKIVIEMIAKLYAIEDDIADMALDGRVEERRRRAGPVLAQIHELLTSWRDERAVLPQTGIGKAVRYVLDRWDGFTAYLDVDSAPIDNNHIERGMRANAMHRKNSLFSASLRGAESYATLLTLTQSAWLKDLDPHAYLLDVIDDMHHDRSPVAKLTPAVYANAGRCLVGKPS